MRAVALILLLPVATACTSTSGVPGGGVGAIRSGIVTDHDGNEVRIDPNSEVRFQRTDSSWTPWRSASALWMSDDGVLMPYGATIAELDRVRVDGVSEADLSELHATAGSSDSLDVDGDSVVLTGKLGPWLTRFVSARATAPSGTWSFRSEGGVWFDGVSGPSLPRIVREGIVAHDGLRWSDIASAEVKNVNGGKTLVGVVAVSALAVGLVAVAVLTKGKVFELPVKAGSAVAEATAHGALHVVVRMPASGCCSGPPRKPRPPTESESPPTEYASMSKPGYELPATGSAYRLFDGVDRRRATYRIGAALDFGGALGKRDGWTAAAVPMLRLTDLFEIGGGLRLLGRGNQADRVWLARVGMHAELDARRRFALPLSIDLGGSSTVSFHARLNFGLRIRVVDAWSIGIYPVNPTYTRLRASLEPVPHWSFPSTVETSFAF